jgi:large subunit ribosomal protein L21
MYAVMISGGKQYRVKEGQSIKLEKLAMDVGCLVEFDKVRMVSDGEKTSIGAPYLQGCVVKADIVGHGRADKIKIVKLKRRKHHLKRMGHRQWYTEVKITHIPAA